MYSKQLIYNFFEQLKLEIYKQNIQMQKGNDSITTLPLWLWILLFITVVVALIICVAVTIIVLMKTRKKINEFNNSEIKNNSKEIQINDINKPITPEEQNQKYKTIYQRLIKNIHIQSKNTAILDVNLIDISKKYSKIINYLKENEINTINDLININDKNIDKFIIDFENSNLNNPIKEKNDFIAFLKQIQNSIRKKGKK